MEARQPPKMVGRERELATLTGYLDDAIAGKGRCVFVSGEAGIGKTRLVEEVKRVAVSRGFRVLSASCFYESLTPYMPFFQALTSEGLEHLFAENVPKVNGVFLLTDSGLLIKHVRREETPLDPDVYASMLGTVTDFVRESVLLSGGADGGGLNRLGYGDHTLLVENRDGVSLAVTLTGRENEFLIQDMRQILVRFFEEYPEGVGRWDGDEDAFHGVESLLGSLIMSRRYDGIPVEERNPQGRRNLLFENIALGLERHLTQGPTVLCLEDLQWADPSTLALTTHVARCMQEFGLLVLGTFRPEDLVSEDGRPHHLSEVLRRLTRDVQSREIKLARLSPSEIAEIVQTILGPMEAGNQLGHRVHRESQGNPLFAVELVRMLAEENWLILKDGVWELPSDELQLEVPSRIHDVLTRRLHRLSEKKRRILESAAVAGEEFSPAVVAVALTMDRVDLLRECSSLMDYGILHRHDGDYRFDHVKFRDVLYEEIPDDVRAILHGRIAESIERISGREVDERADDLAFHYRRSETPEAALPYLKSAAARASARFANEESARLYEEALELEEDAAERIEILEKLAAVHETTGEYGRAIETLEAGLSLGPTDEQQAGLLAKIGWTYYLTGKPNKTREYCAKALDLVKGQNTETEALVLRFLGCVDQNPETSWEILGRSLAVYERLGNQRGVSAVLNAMGLWHKNRGNLAVALDYLRRSLAFDEEMQRHDDASIDCANIALVHQTKGDLDLAIEWNDRSRVLAELAGNRTMVARCQFQTGIVLYDRGDYLEAIERYESARKIWQQIGDTAGVGYTIHEIAMAQAALGDFLVALENLRSAKQMNEERGFRNEVAHTLCTTGRVYRELGNYDGAKRCFGESIAIAEDLGERTEVACVHSALGLLESDAGHLDQARWSFERSLDLAGAMENLTITAEAQCGLAEVHLRLEQYSEASDRCKAALTAAGRTGSKDLSTKAMRVSAMIDRDRGLRTEAETTFQRCFEGYRRMKREPELARTHLEFAILREGEGRLRDAKEHVDLAARLFRKMGMELELRRAVDLQNALDG